MPPIELGLSRSWPDWFQKDPALKRVADLDEGVTTTAGQNVNIYTAMNYSAVWSAVSGISKSIGSFPCCLYRAEAGGRVRLDRHPLFWLLHEEPNPLTTPMTFFETMLYHVLVTGNAYAEISRNGSGAPGALWIADPNKIRPEMRGQSLVYMDSATRNTIPSRDMIHVAGLGWDGMQGYSVITKARESIGAGLAMEKYGGAYYGNGTAMGLVFEHPGRLTQDAQDRLTNNIQRKHQGAERAFRPFVAEENMKVKSVAFSPKDSEFLGSRLYGLEEIARWFDYPVTKLKSKGGERPGGNRELEALEYVVDCLRPWLVRLEQELNRKLIPMRERPDVYCEFNADAYLRGDSKAEAESLQVYFDMGVIDAEYIAQKKNFPKPKPKPAPPPEPMPAPDPEPDAEEAERHASHAAIRTLIIDGMDRLVRIETNEARRNAGKIEAWAAEFYPKHRARLVSLLEPSQRLVRPLAQDSRARAEALADSLLGTHRAALAGGVDALILERWELECPAQVAEEVLGRTA